MTTNNNLESTLRVMVVDDDELVIASVRSFLQMETEYDIVTFTDPQDALDFIRANKVDLVISDYLMPKMNGLELLAKVKQIDQQITRVILTGYADKENAIKAINDVGLFQYLTKPWDNDDLKIVVRNGLEKRRLMAELEQKAGEIQKAYGDLQGLHREILKAFA